jgi:hypothetical protein
MHLRIIHFQARDYPSSLAKDQGTSHPQWKYPDLVHFANVPVPEVARLPTRYGQSQTLNLPRFL